MSSDESKAMGRESGFATLQFETNFVSTEMKGFRMPVEVRDSELRVVGNTITNLSLQVSAPGKYYVLARLPAGQEITRVVEVQPNEIKRVQLVLKSEGLSPIDVGDEVSHYLGLPESTILPTSAPSKPARRASSVVAPRPIEPPMAVTAGRDSSLESPSGTLGYLSFEAAVPRAPEVPLIDPIDELLAEYASASSIETKTTLAPESVETRTAPALVKKQKVDFAPCDLYLRLFRGSALALQARALKPAEWIKGFHEGVKGRLTIVGVNELSTLQIIQPGRPGLNVVLPVSEGWNCEVVISRPVELTDQTHADDVSIDVHMGNLQADALLRYRSQRMSTEATELLRAKFEDPIGAAVGAYWLLQLNQLERRGWVNNLYNNFPWLPDAAAIEGECLAREGKQDSSLHAFLEVAERGLPMFTEGLSYTIDRLDLFFRGDPSELDPEKLRRARVFRELLGNFCRFVDFRKLMLTYTGRQPGLPGAEAGNVSPELIAGDPTLLELNVEGGVDGNIRIVESQNGVTVKSSEALHEKSANLVADLEKVNDPQSVALRVQRMASRAGDELLEAVVNQDEVLEHIVAESSNIGIDFLKIGALAARTVPGIRTGAKTGVIGTGFMVSPRLLLTTHHVLPNPAVAMHGSADFDSNTQSTQHLTQPQIFALDPQSFFLSDQNLDFTLVCLEKVSFSGVSLSEFGFNRLSADPGKILVGEFINIIHHPRGGPKVLSTQQGRLLDHSGDFIHYDANTAPGSAGAPVFNNQWEVVALHHAALVLEPNNVPVNEGIRISSILRYCRAALVGPSQQQILDELFSPPEVIVSYSYSPERPPLISPPVHPPPRESTSSERPELKTESTRNLPETKTGPEAELTPRVKGEPGMTSSSTSQVATTLTVPLHITISLGTSVAPTAQPGVAVSKPAITESFLEKIEPDENYDDRPGYDPKFLGFNVPMPKLSAEMKSLAVKVPGGGHTLKYYHYSVIMNQRRRLAFVSAGNYYADSEFIHEREGGDKWFMDPRISEDFQAGEEIYSSNPLDRGHLVRRAAAAWGNTKTEARLANDDTFHFTNCSPQHEVFNQSSKATKRKLILWGNIENHIASQATHVTNRKVTIFNGPVFRQNDRKHRGLQIPREYWKIVAFQNDEGQRRAAAFILSQAALIKTLPTEDFMIGPYDVYQVKVREIETKTQLDFGSLRTHDALEEPGSEGFFEAETDALVVSDLRGMIL